MKLVFIIGNSAVGKMTVGQELMNDVPPDAVALEIKERFRL